MDRDTFDLNGQIALVTGAGQGAGRAIALSLAEHNSGGLAINDFVSERAESVAKEVRKMGVPACAVPADVGDYAAIDKALIQAQDTLGPVTILVNNAGNAGPESTMGASPLFWETEPDDCVICGIREELCPSVFRHEFSAATIVGQEQNQGVFKLPQTL